MPPPVRISSRSNKAIISADTILKEKLIVPPPRETSQHTKKARLADCSYSMNQEKHVSEELISSYPTYFF